MPNKGIGCGAHRGADDELGEAGDVGAARATRIDGGRRAAADGEEARIRRCGGAQLELVAVVDAEGSCGARGHLPM